MKMSISETDTESGASSSMGKGSFSSADLRPNKSKSGAHHHHIHHRGTWPRAVQETLSKKSLFWPSVALLLATMLILVSMMSGFLYLNTGSRHFSSNMCLSVDCITAASDMLRSLDTNVDPCDDYYEYSCGGWIRLNSIQDDESRADTYSVIRNEMSEKLKLLLESPIVDEDSSAIRKVKNFYVSCVDTKTIEDRKEKPLLDLLDNDFGGWSMIGRESSKLQSMDWVNMMGILRQYNNEIIIGHNVGPHDSNSSLYTLKIYPAGLGMSSADFYLNRTSKTFVSYRRLIERISHLLGAPQETLSKDIEDILDFESRLANISSVYEKNGGAAYQKMTIMKLSKLVPKINWNVYFQLAVPVTLNDSESVGIFGLDYFLDVQDIVGVTPERTIKNYLLWRFVMNRIKNLDTRFENALEDYYRDQYGTKSIPARWKKCIDFVNGNLGIAVSALYVRKYFDLESKHSAEEMIANIKAEFMLILGEVEWMDEETRNDARVKAQMMEEHIGFPDYILNPDALDKDYDHLNFSGETYFENVVGYLQNSTKKSQSKIYEADDRSKWTVQPSVVNAQYHRYRNLMSFPAAILQSPLFNKNYPPPLNYGAIGSVIGHELTHGFDSNGRHHDQFGNQRLWWHPNTIDRFIKKSACMVDQYNNYTVDVNGQTYNSNGLLTLGENIADNGGIKQSYRAFRKVQQRSPETSLDLPGLNMTQEQLFFLKFAQSWCQIMTDEGLVESVKTWRHSLGKFRVIGTLSNFKEFSKAYQCPLGSKMNPAKKCDVW